MTDNNNIVSELVAALEKLGGREFEIAALTMDANRGMAALDYAVTKGANNPIAYAIKLFDNPDWQPSAARPRNATNQAVATQCLTCGGDRFVLVGTRPLPRGSHAEEYAACPDCNPSDTTFRRGDGSVAKAYDPGRVREFMVAAPAPGPVEKTDIPEWVFVWSWARRKGAKRPFPQQADQGLDGEPLTEAEYEHLRELWMKAGSPRPKDPVAVAMIPATKSVTDVLDGVLS